MAGWAQIQANLTRLALQDPNTKITEALEPDSDVLGTIHDAFKSIVFDNAIRIHSFQEARGISGMMGLHNKVRVLPVESQMCCVTNAGGDR